MLNVDEVRASTDFTYSEEVARITRLCEHRQTKQADIDMDNRMRAEKYGPCSAEGQPAFLGEDGRREMEWAQRTRAVWGCGGFNRRKRELEEGGGWTLQKNLPSIAKQKW